MKIQTIEEIYHVLFPKREQGFVTICGDHVYREPFRFGCNKPNLFFFSFEFRFLRGRSVGHWRCGRVDCCSFLLVLIF